MIYVVEVYPDAKAKAWFAFDQEDLARKVRGNKMKEGQAIYDASTPRELLAVHEKTPETEGARQQHGDLFHLADTHGWDTVLYRADYLLGQGVYQPEPVEEHEACFAAIQDGLKSCRLYGSDQEAAAELYRDPLYEGREGFNAHMVLREQLIAMEVISDDL